MTYLDEYGTERPVLDECEAALAHDQGTCDSTCDYCEHKAPDALSIVLNAQRTFHSPTVGYLILENVILHLLDTTSPEDDYEQGRR